MTKISEKNTKTDILKAYAEVIKEKQALETQLRNTERALEKANENALRVQANASLNGNGQKPAPEVKEKIVTQIIEKPANADNIEGIINILEGIEKGMGNAAGKIAAQLVVEADQLSELLKEKEEALQALEKMYDLKPQDGAVEKLIKEYESLFEEFERDFQNKSESFEELVYERQKESIKEQQNQAQSLTERQENDGKEQQRENEQYDYDIAHARSLEDDAYNQKTKHFFQDLEDLTEKKQEEWKNKEKEIGEKEKERQEYKSKFEEIPERLEKEGKKAEAEGKAIVEKDNKTKTDLLNKEAESKHRIFDIKTDSLKNTLSKQDAQLAALNKQLDSALKQVQELAVKAIDGNSRAESFDALREIALEQAKTQQKNK